MGSFQITSFFVVPLLLNYGKDLSQKQGSMGALKYP